MLRVDLALGLGLFACVGLAVCLIRRGQAWRKERQAVSKRLRELCK